MLRAIPFHRVAINDRFWSPRLETNRRVTVHAALDRCEETGRIRNFAVTGGLEQGAHEGRRYNDSDVYKILEGAAYTLSQHPDEGLERRVDEVIDKIAAAQQSDGYLNTWITLTAPNERWDNIYWGHELYCAGHLIEAAIAYRHATGKVKLLDVARRFADNILEAFGPDQKQRKDPPGHQELELALVKLADETDDDRYLQQAAFFLRQRGRCETRDSYGSYCQDHAPVTDQREAVGHSVRAVYQYCGMCDVAARTGDDDLIRTLGDLWTDVTERKMYVTGGIGSTKLNEGFTEPYDLPNETAYCETCASIGLTLWAHRMFLRDPHSKYLDVFEQSLYNALIAGVSLSGDRFFYDNPLASRGKHHRVPWFDCSCCPTNIVRYLPSIGDRIYAAGPRDLYVCQYIGSETSIDYDGSHVRVTLESEMPWNGSVRLHVDPETRRPLRLHLRIPEWTGGICEARVNGELSSGDTTNGFLIIDREWSEGDLVELTLPMSVERLYDDPRVVANVGRVAIRRGPVVYAAEAIDHGGSVYDLRLPRDQPLTASHDPDLLNGATVIEGKAVRSTMAPRSARGESVSLRLIPYFLWDHRDPGEMLVWMRELR